MDKERLKKGHMFTDEYFERQLENIREIRLSERKFYQKVTDLYATAFDYDKEFTVSDKCISRGKPEWNGNCTHCMACIGGCPTETIGYQSKSNGRNRYYIMEE